MPSETHADPDLRRILAHQHPGGAYVASPDYSQYPYCWLRDGSFIAHAADAGGAHDSARAFHGWVARTLLAHEGHVRELVAAAGRGETPDHARMLPARFTLEGGWEEDDWPAFQLDGYGQWLWSLERHRELGSSPAAATLRAAELVARYLAAYGLEPCYDAWEEGRTRHHASTLASVAAGLRSAARLLDEPAWARTAADVWRRVETACVLDGRFTKEARMDAVDASLLWLATPFDLVADDDPRFAATLERVERELLVDGGVTRYRADTFYGGGAWVLLTAWLAWHHARAGRPERAAPLLAWVEAQRRPDGGLPEQVATSRTDAWFRDWWTRRWGPPAEPLLWSHAVALLARAEVARRAPAAPPGRTTGA